MRYTSGLTRDTYLLSFTSLFADVSTEMLYPVLPSLVASVAGGQLWDRFGPAATFWYGAALGLVGMIAVVMLVSQSRPAVPR